MSKVIGRLVISEEMVKSLVRDYLESKRIFNAELEAEHNAEFGEFSGYSILLKDEDLNSSQETNPKTSPPSFDPGSEVSEE